MIVADASWVMALMDPEDEHHAEAVSLVDTLTRRPLMHCVTLSECLVAPARTGQHERADRELRAAFAIVDADEGSPLRWAQLRASQALRLPDAIVVDTALVSRAPHVATFDHRLTAAAIRLGVGVLP